MTKLTQKTRPYTTREVLDKIAAALGIAATRAYINNVILKPKSRREDHPLKGAKLAGNMWDRDTVDQYLREITIVKREPIDTGQPCPKPGCNGTLIKLRENSRVLGCTTCQTTYENIPSN